MTVTVETLDKLQRRITLTLPADAIAGEVTSRLKKLARTVKADGFRPGKVPGNLIRKMHGESLHREAVTRRELTMKSTTAA